MYVNMNNMQKLISKMTTKTMDGGLVVDSGQDMMI